MVGVPRDLGTDVAEWSAVVAPFTHEGFTPYGGRKVSSRLLHALAIDVARHARVEEALLFDPSERLVEGAHTNLFAVTDTSGGVICTAASGPGSIVRPKVAETLSPPDPAEMDTASGKTPANRPA